MAKEIYISVDVEADGPVPGTYSMTALGAVVCGWKDSDGSIHRLDVTDPANRFYSELKPISENWVPEAMRVGIFEGFSAELAETDPTGEKRRQYLLEEGEDPAEAMTSFSTWVERVKSREETNNVVFAAYPLGFDWMFTYWYLVTYAEAGSPFGHSRHIDIKTLYSEKANALISRSVKRNIPKKLHSKLPHTHLAVQDAAEQGELLMNILLWEGKQ